MTRWAKGPHFIGQHATSKTWFWNITIWAFETFRIHLGLTVSVFASHWFEDPAINLKKVFVETFDNLDHVGSVGFPDIPRHSHSVSACTMILYRGMFKSCLTEASRGENYFHGICVKDLFPVGIWIIQLFRRITSPAFKKTQLHESGLFFQQPHCNRNKTMKEWNW